MVIVSEFFEKTMVHFAYFIMGLFPGFAPSPYGSALNFKKNPGLSKFQLT